MVDSLDLHHPVALTDSPVTVVDRKKYLLPVQPVIVSWHTNVGGAPFLELTWTCWTTVLPKIVRLSVVLYRSFIFAAAQSPPVPTELIKLEAINIAFEGALAP